MTAYSNLLIYYLSGTGNAMQAAKWIAEDFGNSGIKSQVYSIDRNISSIKPIAANTLLGFCFPTHGFSLAPYMLNFILKFPKCTNKTHVFLLNTRAGMKLSKLFLPGLSGLAQILPALILLLKGYKIRYMQPLDLPSNWISIHPGIKAKVVASIFERCRGIISRMSNRLLTGKRRYQAFWSLPFDLAVAPISVLYYFIGRYGLAKTFYSTKDCNQCNLCIDLCPVQAISYKRNHPFWSYKCESCMRCMNICPERAIQTSHGYSIPLWIAISGIIESFVFSEINKITDVLLQKNVWTTILDFLIQGITFLLVIFIAYFCTHFLLKIKVVDIFFRYTSLTYFKFWRRYRSPDTKISGYKKDRIQTT
ncbi:MAG: 4Fe-4S binding protein [Bacteroidetes bacterium]|nr:4Fe-4S binding protein [Bacteroidota bacterium]MBT5529925.1 4Fe-4S binding protein [Cytophagia bacterium]